MNVRIDRTRSRASFTRCRGRTAGSTSAGTRAEPRGSRDRSGAARRRRPRPRVVRRQRRRRHRELELRRTAATRSPRSIRRRAPRSTCRRCAARADAASRGAGRDRRPRRHAAHDEPPAAIHHAHDAVPARRPGAAALRPPAHGTGAGTAPTRTARRAGRRHRARHSAGTLGLTLSRCRTGPRCRRDRPRSASAKSSSIFWKSSLPARSAIARGIAGNA